jgi:hypothetical protein
VNEVSKRHRRCLQPAGGVAASSPGGDSAQAGAAPRARQPQFRPLAAQRRRAAPPRPVRPRPAGPARASLGSDCIGSGAFGLTRNPESPAAGAHRAQCGVMVRTIRWHADPSYCSSKLFGAKDGDDSRHHHGTEAPGPARDHRSSIRPRRRRA